MKYFVQNSTSTFSLFKSCGAQAVSSPRQQQKQQQQRFTRDQFLALARNGACTEYAPNRFHAIVMRLRTGSTSTTTTSTAAAPMHSGELRNLVSTLHMPYRLNIEGMAQHLLQCMTISGKRPNDNDSNNNNSNSNNLAGQIVGVARACLDLCTFPGLRCALRIGGQQKGGTEEGSMGEAEFVVTGLFFISGTVIVTGVRDPLLMKRAVDTIQHLCAQYIRA
ncbi:hypothetical protein niasHS_011678 [Heterodera schachtii]|uniref:Uncharacterized protein n=1 Tax=Heterodera schachtii TaxID=97005 RepID=A0ABD2IMZ2_HETSC